LGQKVVGKLVLFMVTSVDGYFEGQDHDISWHMVDDEFNDFAVKQLKEFRALLFGRRTYQLMVSWWPTVTAEKDDPVVAGLMNSAEKYVFSHTLQTAAWENTTLVKDEADAFVRNLKARNDKDIAIFGSNNFCVSLMGADLVDEFRIMTCPVAIGTGLPLFSGLAKRENFIRGNVREFSNGNVLVTYQKA